jgi:hypothetical protein
MTGIFEQSRKIRIQIQIVPADIWDKYIILNIPQRCPNDNRIVAKCSTGTIQQTTNEEASELTFKCRCERHGELVQTPPLRVSIVTVKLNILLNAR